MGVLALPDDDEESADLPGQLASSSAEAKTTFRPFLPALASFLASPGKSAMDSIPTRSVTTSSTSAGKAAISARGVHSGMSAKSTDGFCLVHTAISRWG